MVEKKDAEKPKQAGEMEEAAAGALIVVVEACRKLDQQWRQRVLQGACEFYGFPVGKY